MASTTSTEQSGLFAHLLPAFKKATGIEVRVVAVGTGQALDMGRRGDADVLFVHDQSGRGEVRRRRLRGKRSDVMYNDFVLVGRQSAIRPASRVATSSRRWQSWPRRSAAFVSRGDKSGTHRRRAALLEGAGVDAAGGAHRRGYKECGCGMGPALNIACVDRRLRR